MAPTTFTQTSGTSMSFLSLPGEVRNCIYQLLFSDPVHASRCPADETHVDLYKGPLLGSSANVSPNTGQILATCHQIRHEAAQFYYKGAIAITDYQFLHIDEPGRLIVIADALTNLTVHFHDSVYIDILSLNHCSSLKRFQIMSRTTPREIKKRRALCSKAISLLWQVKSWLQSHPSLTMALSADDRFYHRHHYRGGNTWLWEGLWLVLVKAKSDGYENDGDVFDIDFEIQRLSREHAWRSL